MTTGFASGISGTVARQAGSLSPGKTRGGVSGPLAGELIMSLIDRFLYTANPAAIAYFLAAMAWSTLW
jgi:hypothetical protein